MKTIFLYLSLISTFILFSQENIKLVDSKEIILKGYEYFQDGEYDKAIKKFILVEKNDTNYLLAQYELAYTYNENEEYKECVDICRNYLKHANQGDENEYSIYNMLGLSLDNMDKSDESIKVYDEALKKYPKYPLYTLNKAVSYNNMDKRDKALVEYKKLANEHPSYAIGHIHLGYVAANENKNTQALLSFAMGVILSGKVTHLSLLNTYAEGNFEPEEYGLKLNKDINDDNFEELDLIIKNKIALDKSYKTPIKFNYPFIKQLYVTIDKLEYNPKDKGFWMQYYVPYFIALREDGQMNNFAYYLLGVSTNEDVQKKVKNKLPEMKEFYAWHEKKWAKLKDRVETTINGVKGTYTKFYSKGLPYGTGILSDNDKLNGPWEFYHKNSKISSTGEFKDSKKTGKWTYYNINGTISYEANFIDDVKVGKYIDYDENGFKSEAGSFKNEKLEGEVKTYYKDRTVKGDFTFKNGKRIGTSKEYHQGGEIEFEIPYDDGIHGEVKTYYPNGKQKSISNWKKGERHGVSTNYFVNGKIKNKYNYNEGKYEGIYAEYYINGQLKEKGQYDNGKQVGEIVYYYMYGVLRMQLNLDESGKRNGSLTQYSEDEYKFYEANYSKGELISYKHFDKKGNTTKELERKRNKIELEFIFDNAQTKAKGLLIDDKRDGEWKFYRRNGSLETIENYDKDDLEGKYINYYSSGQISSQYNYKDGKLDGYYTSFHPNGKIKSEGNYVNGNREGNWLTYFIDGEINEKDYYLLDNLHGLLEEYNIDGKLNATYKYDNGLILESYTYDTKGNIIDTVPFNFGSAKIEYKTVTGDKSRVGLFKNGKAYGKHQYFEGKNVLYSEGEFLKGEKTGSWNYYDFGKLSSSENFDFGYLNGDLKKYHLNGKIKQERQYNYDINVDTWKYYHDNGKLNRDMPHKNNKRHGISHYYSPEGDLQYVKYHHNGDFVGYSYENKDGKLVEMIPIEKETGTIKAYFANGKVSAEADIKFGAYVGVSKRYYKNGQLESDLPHKLGDNNGNYKYYYADGNTKEEGTFYYDELEGKRTLYYTNGKKKMEMNYKNGTLYGTVSFYNESGNKTKEIKYYNDDIIEQKTF